MSFLSILLVASAFYFAHARPDSQSRSELFAADQSGDHVGEEATYLADSSAPVFDPRDYQLQLYKFMNILSETVDKYMTPLMTELNVKKQEELKDMGLNGFASYINYLLLLIEETKHEKGDAQTHGDSFPRNEMILQYESQFPFDPDTPHMTEIEDEDVEDEEE